MHVDFVWIIYITPKFQLSINYFTIIKLFEQKRPYTCTCSILINGSNKGANEVEAPF